MNLYKRDRGIDSGIVDNAERYSLWQQSNEKNECGATTNEHHYKQMPTERVTEETTTRLRNLNI